MKAMKKFAFVVWVKRAPSFGYFQVLIACRWKVINHSPRFHLVPIFVCVSWLKWYCPNFSYKIHGAGLFAYIWTKSTSHACNIYQPSAGKIYQSHGYHGSCRIVKDPKYKSKRRMFSCVVKLLNKWHLFALDLDVYCECSVETLAWTSNVCFRMRVWQHVQNDLNWMLFRMILNLLIPDDGIHPQSLTSKLKWWLQKRNVLIQGLIFRWIMLNFTGISPKYRLLVFVFATFRDTQFVWATPKNPQVLKNSKWFGLDPQNRLGGSSQDL